MIQVSINYPEALNLNIAVLALEYDLSSTNDCDGPKKFSGFNSLATVALFEEDLLKELKKNQEVFLDVFQDGILVYTLHLTYKGEIIRQTSLLQAFELI